MDSADPIIFITGIVIGVLFGAGTRLGALDGYLLALRSRGRHQRR